METPTPITFKTLTRAHVTDVALDCLELTYCTLEAYKPTKGNGYFQFTSKSNPVQPLRVYPSAMSKLPNLLEYAITEAAELEQQKLPDNENYNCGTLNEHGNMMVRLVLSTFQERVNIWLRLYTLGEDGAILPTRTGVRFSPKDDVETIFKFIAKNKKNLI